MKYMQISFWKDTEVRNYTKGEMQDKSFYSVAWFKNPKFRKVYDTKQRTQFIRKKLETTSREEMNFSEEVPLNRFEEVVVTEQKHHEIGQAIYHQRIKIPEKLVNTKQQNTRVREW